MTKEQLSYEIVKKSRELQQLKQAAEKAMQPYQLQNQKLQRQLEDLNEQLAEAEKAEQEPAEQASATVAPAKKDRPEPATVAGNQRARQNGQA